VHGLYEIKKRTSLNLPKVRNPLDILSPLIPTPNKIRYNHSKEKYIPWPEASSKAKAIIDLWNEIGCGNFHRKTTHLIGRVLYLLDAQILKKYNSEEVEDVLYEFSRMNKFPRKYGLPDKKISIEDFFKVSSFVRARFRKAGQKIPKSYFERVLKYDFKKISNLSLSDRIRRFYGDHVLGEKKIAFTNKQERDFVEAGRKLKKYMKHRRLEKYVEGANQDDYIRLLFKALSNKWGLSFGSGHLNSPYTYNDLIPKYLSEAYGI